MTPESFEIEEQHVKCKKCGWVHFQVTADTVRKWKFQWTVDWKKMSEETREMFGCKNAPPSEEGFLKCIHCGNSYRDFEDAKEDDAPRGVNICGILDRNQQL